MAHEPILVKAALNGLDEARRELTAHATEQLTYQILHDWRRKFRSQMVRAEKLTGAMIVVNSDRYLAGYDTETDTAVLDSLRNRLLSLIDRNIGALDATRVPQKPELRRLAEKVKDEKLAILLKEFTDMQATQPNAAAILLRTILGLIIKERAKLHAPHLPMASSDDLNFAKDVATALEEQIFPSGEHKYLEGFNKHLLKPAYDNIAHKAGANWVIKDKKDLEAGVELITKLLHTIV